MYLLFLEGVLEAVVGVEEEGVPEGEVFAPSLGEVLSFPPY